MLPAELAHRIAAAQHSAPAAEPKLRDAADRIFVAHILGLPLPAAATDDLCEETDRAARDPGSLTLHSFGMGIRALNMAKLSRPNGFLLPEHRLSEGDCLGWLQERNWAEPWRASIDVLHLMLPRLLNGTLAPNRLFPVLESYQDEGGGWGTDTPHRQMAAAFHFIPLYRAAERVMPRIETLASGVLSNEPAAPGFGTMDALYVLFYAARVGAIRNEAIDREAYRKHVLPEPGSDRHAFVASAEMVYLMESLDSTPGLRDAWEPTLWAL